MPQAAPQLVAPVDDATDLTVRAWKFLEKEMKQLGTPLPGPVVPVLKFRKLAEAHPTTPEERLAIIEQAELLFDHLYPHMPFKTEFFHFDPPRVFLDEARKGIETLSETDFHAWMIAAFSIVRDAHTIYGLPSPYRGATAFLPFQMASIVDPAGERRFIVLRIMSSGEKGGFGHRFFGPGAEIVEWGGAPIELHVQRAGGRLPGGNASAGFARATQACTIRPLTYVQFPFDDEMPAAEIVYREQPMAKDLRAIRLPWGVVRFPAGAAFPRRGFSISFLNEEFNRGQQFMCREGMWKEQELRNSDDPRAVSEIPEVFEFQYTGGPRDGHPIDLANLEVEGRPDIRLGYLRIKSFNTGSDAPGETDRLVKEARRILTLLDEHAPDGLILDIRSNSGGDIEAAERMLQMLTPHPITPENFHFANTETIIGVLREIRAGLKKKRLSASVRAKLEEAKLEFDDWLDDADRDPHPRSPERLTSGRPLTSPDSCNDVGQVYHGPIVLLIDGFTYSAADIFAAGFEDHDIGFIFGRDGVTGGGGANVWNHSDLLTKLGPKPGIPVARLPRDATMRLAIRRCSRVGRNEGKPIEDFGVKAAQLYVTNIVDDVIAGMPGMVQEAAGIIAHKMRPFRVDVPGFELRGNGVAVTVRSTFVTSLRFFLDGRPAAKRAIEPGKTRTFHVPPVKGLSEPSVLRIEGYSNEGLRPGVPPRLVTVRTVALREVKAEEERSDAEESKAAARRRRRRK